MPRDISLEKTLLEILDLLSPEPMRETVLAHEAEIRLDRCLLTTDVQDALQSLHERKFVRRGESRMGLPICWITEAGRAAMRS
jgi:hypothetical protein